MDFLTQPLHPTAAVALPNAPSFNPSLTEPTNASSSTSPIAYTPDDTSSILTMATTTTDGGYDQHIASANAFAQLRTISGRPQSEEEPLGRYPSLKEGDWRTFGRVEARVIVWQDGQLRGSNSKGGKGERERAEESWTVEGTIWITRDHQLLFVVDQNKPPRQASLAKTGGATPPRRFTHMLKRNPSSSGSAGDATEVSLEDDEESESVVQKFVNLFRRGSKDGEEGEEGGNGLKLTKTRTGDRALKLERTKSASEPVLPLPLPTVQGYSVTCLRVATPASILRVQHFPRRSSAHGWTASLFGSASEPLSSPNPDNSTNLDQDSNVLTRIASFTREADQLPPCVELDVSRDPTGRKAGQRDAAKERDVTIGFVFKESETLLSFGSKEAEDFHEFLQSITKC